jgi:hypothetical protein
LNAGEVHLPPAHFKQGVFHPFQVKRRIKGGLLKALVQAVRPTRKTDDSDPCLAALLVKKTAIDDRNLFAAVVYIDAVPPLQPKPRVQVKNKVPLADGVDALKQRRSAASSGRWLSESKVDTTRPKRWVKLKSLALSWMNSA